MIMHSWSLGIITFPHNLWYEALMVIVLRTRPLPSFCSTGITIQHNTSIATEGSDLVLETVMVVGCYDSRFL